MKILVVDDHALFCEGLCYVLEKLDNNVSILEANNFNDAVTQLNTNIDIDMVLLDLNMPDKDGFSVLDFCREHYPLISIVVLSASKKRSDMNRALEAGAMGFIPKDTTSNVMLGAIRLIMTGDIYVPQSMAMNVPDEDEELANSFTPRQLEIIPMMIKGFSNKKIALEMGISEATIKMHVTAIFKRLEVNNRTEAALAARTLGFIE
ncbi:response regulator transcription factor [Paraglaciecola sp. 25GB23A]|uniref:response regulator transcription factor n=1 Tax=Paraglaciecola sp. 25GB23A TaxID=3156068 RepID=UPI0032AEF533